MSIGLSCGKSNSTNGYTSTPAPSAGAANTITIANMVFSPDSKKVAKGATFKWTNNDDYPTRQHLRMVVALTVVI